MSDALEEALEKWCCTYLRTRGAYAEKRGQCGEGDREVFWGAGLIFWLEFKKEKGPRRASQVVFQKWVKASGYEYEFVHTRRDFLDFIRVWELVHGPPSVKRPT